MCTDFGSLCVSSMVVSLLTGSVLSKYSYFLVCFSLSFTSNVCQFYWSIIGGDLSKQVLGCLEAAKNLFMKFCHHFCVGSILHFCSGFRFGPFYCIP